ncbi:macro domain-containing protein [Marinobacter mobilis]|uniref:O-acetyl-ADP-ribose deacetylase (Regulator of RNase III), contains Macro domain n=1 Tax=Marinobacter mobilis TaxID=488533 RepID=A0A1H2QEW7_9GAMM|nr:macro domain-containing protein [Marinobacter mobilis]SDW05615.1 O-acetyl-ADP-ribose deacetylase (regulator of RNase III), contains Macro domain [Marinobacter mobilis]
MAILTIECVRGDIARQPDIDAVVNAANAQLLSGAGVAGAIHRAAGPELAQACRPLAPIHPGEAVISDAFGLPNRHVIHCLGPVYGVDEPSAQLLAACYRNALRLADRHGLVSVAFPAISTGVFGYPLAEAAEVALAAVWGCAAELTSLRRVRFVLFSEADREVFQRILDGGEKSPA